jgi:glyoxylase I family protein
MINLAAIDHVVFRVKDMAGMIRFYEDVLGARVEREVPELGLVQLRAGTSLIDFVDVNGKIGRQKGAAPGEEGQNVDHVCFRVLPWNGSAILEHLVRHGFEKPEIASRYGAEGQGPSIYISDPEGNDLELKGPPQAAEP